MKSNFIYRVHDNDNNASCYPTITAEENEFIDWKCNTSKIFINLINSRTRGSLSPRKSLIPLERN